MKGMCRGVRWRQGDLSQICITQDHHGSSGPNVHVPIYRLEVTFPVSYVTTYLQYFIFLLQPRTLMITALTSLTVSVEDSISLSVLIWILLQWQLQLALAPFSSMWQEIGRKMRWDLVRSLSQWVHHSGSSLEDCYPVLAFLYVQDSMMTLQGKG